MACLPNDFFFILSLDLLSFFLDSTELLELLLLLLLLLLLSLLVFFLYFGLTA